MSVSPERQLSLFDKGKLDGWPTAEEIRATWDKQESLEERWYRARREYPPPSQEKLNKPLR